MSKTDPYLEIKTNLEAVFEVEIVFTCECLYFGHITLDGWNNKGKKLLTYLEASKNVFTKNG